MRTPVMLVAVALATTGCTGEGGDVARTITADTPASPPTDVDADADADVDVDADAVPLVPAETDIVELRTRAAATDEAVVVDVCQRLERGSRNHLRAFVRQLDRLGEPYEPTVLDDVDEIVDGPTEPVGSA